MTIPPDDNGCLHEFELSIQSELALSETIEPDLDAGVVAPEPTFDGRTEGYEEVEYEETERYEAGLRSLLGAIEAVEAAAPRVRKPR